MDEVTKGRARIRAWARTRAFPLVLLFALAFFSACGAVSTVPDGRARVQFHVTPDTARVYTDERFVGAARVLAVRPPEFRAGTRRFTITADGYFPHDLEIELAPGTTTIEIRLRPIPP